MNIFGLHIGLTSAVVSREQYDLLLTEGDTLRRFLTDEQGISAELRKSNRMLQESKVVLEKQLESSRERETDLEKRIKSMESQLEAKDGEIIAAQRGRLEHNDILYRVGKSWLNFKTAWQFRKDNPKMAPRERTANNTALNASIADVDQLLPKRIADPTEKAIKDIAGDPPKTKKPAY
jgi:hypothetical protein